MKKGRQALESAGFSPEFITECMVNSFDLACSFALRAGQPPNTNKGFPVTYKPMLLKTNTCNNAQGIPLLAGFIAWDQKSYGRRGSDPLPSMGYEAVQLKVSLKELLVDAEKGFYSLKKRRDSLEFQPLKADGPLKRNITFRIHLNEGSPPEIAPNDSKSKQNPLNQKTTAWLSKNQLNQLDLNQLFLVEERKPNQPDFKSLYVAGKKGLPVTGDADILWISPLTNFVKKHAHLTTQVYDMNSNDPNQLAELTNQYLFLHHALTGNKLTMTKAASAVNAFANGMMTPFEYAFEKIISDSSKTELFQHGPETNHPKNPSQLDAPMLILHKGIPVLTENEEELIQFVLTEDFLKEHFIPVHPKWNMEKWGPVVAKQLELKQEDIINPKTLKAFHAHYADGLQVTQSKPASLSTATILKGIRSATRVEYKVDPVAKMEEMKMKKDKKMAPLEIKMKKNKVAPQETKKNAPSTLTEEKEERSFFSRFRK